MTVKRSKVIVCRVNENEFDVVKTMANEMDFTMSHLVRVSLMQFIGQHAMEKKVVEAHVLEELKLSRQDLKKLLAVL